MCTDRPSFRPDVGDVDSKLRKIVEAIRQPLADLESLIGLAALPMSWHFEDFDQLVVSPDIPQRIGGLSFSGLRHNCRIEAIEIEPFLRLNVLHIFDTYDHFDIRFDRLVKTIRFGHVSGKSDIPYPEFSLLDDQGSTIYGRHPNPGGAWFNYAESARPIRTLRFRNPIGGAPFFNVMLDNLTWVPFYPDDSWSTSLDENFNDTPLGSYGNALQTARWNISRGSGNLDILYLSGRSKRLLAISHVATTPINKVQYLDTFTPRLAVHPKLINMRLWSDIGGGVSYVVAGYAKNADSPVRYVSTTVRRNSASQLVTVEGAKSGEFLISLQIKHDEMPGVMYYDNIWLDL